MSQHIENAPDLNNLKDDNDSDTILVSSLSSEVESAPVNQAFFNGPEAAKAIQGLIDHDLVSEKLQHIRSMDVKAYESVVIQPARDSHRYNAKSLINQIVNKKAHEIDAGPLYAVTGYLGSELNSENQRIAFIAQNREYENGTWGPHHHKQAADFAIKCAQKGLPIVTLIDTPGADAGEMANAQNQAHSISELITVMAQLPVPTVGIIVGTAYSGGAIPLAATNLLLSVRDGLFSTIQPQGLSSIARKQKLAWQQCAQLVSVGAFESLSKEWIDGVIDYSPSEQAKGIENLRAAITGAISYIEQGALAYLSDNDNRSDAEHIYHKVVDNTLNKEFDSRHIGNCFYSPQPNQAPSIFDVSIRAIRQQQVTSRLACTVTDLFDQHDVKENVLLAVNDAIPQKTFLQEWLEKSDKLIYEERLVDRYKQFLKSLGERDEQRNVIISMVLGNPESNYQTALSGLCFELGLYLYNRWKTNSVEGFSQLVEYLQSCEQITADSHPKLNDLTLANIIVTQELNQGLQQVCQYMQLFDALYDGVLSQLQLVAREANKYQKISPDSMARLIQAARENLEQRGLTFNLIHSDFTEWLENLERFRNLAWFLRKVAEWKQHQHVRISDSLFVFITYFFERLLPKYISSRKDSSEFDGEIKPTWIGRRKDFWHRISVAYCDLEIQALQKEFKAQWPDWSGWVDELCSEFNPLYQNWVTQDPCSFPGFKESVNKQINQNRVPAGVVTGIAQLKDAETRFGLAISNLEFQAGALDMASANKLISLIKQCEKDLIPFVGVFSSGGMQTKEGAGSLFAMAAVNETITQYKQQTGLPVIMIGFGDCTGGAQASFVTHPLAETWYISGANIPFAGQIVVPSYLPSTCTLANYLASTSNSMTGLLSHPFAISFDKRLKEIDPEIIVPEFSIHEMLAQRLKASSHVLKSSITANLSEKVYGHINKVLIHARGCTATKLIRDIKRTGTSIVLVQSDPDMNSVPAELLGPDDELVCIGGNTPDESYLNANSVLKVASNTGAEALHPGIGFLSEDPDFAKRCQDRGLNFIGPDFRSMIQMGDKSIALKVAQEAGVPIVPGSHGVISDELEAKRLAEEIQFPLLLKAAFGGGGKGIAKVDSMDELAETFVRLTREAESAFGRGDLYMERFVTSMRHIEVQVLRDSHGNCQLLGIRDCSVQRNNQKLFEESGSTLLPQTLKQEALTYARNISNHVNYVGAGTVEFIFDLKHECLYFMEMNTRLQVEHPVTEMVTGVDIVPLQLDIAAGSSIQDLAFTEQNYAIEARINAESVTLDSHGIKCQPSPGLIQSLSLPKHENVQVISCVDTGKAVAPYYDSMIMQIIAKGQNREQAIERLANFLKDIEIKGIATNIGLLCAILNDTQFYNGDFDTGFIGDFANRLDKNLLQSADSEAQSAKEDITIPDSDELKVLSPSTSIFYRSATPNDAPYVEEGDVIDIHQTICLMEAMKSFSPMKLSHLNSGNEALFNSDHKYKVNRILNDDGQQVNAGDLLFVLEPLAEV